MNRIVNFKSYKMNTKQKYSKVFYLLEFATLRLKFFCSIEHSRSFGALKKSYTFQSFIHTVVIEIEQASKNHIKYFCITHFCFFSSFFKIFELKIFFPT